MAKTTDHIVKPIGVQPTIGISSLSPLDQIMPRVYTRLVLCIHLQSTSPGSQATALASLGKGLQETISQIPSLSGAIGSEKKNGDKVHIISGSGVLLRAKDLTGDSSWSYAKLREAGFPLSSLDDDILTPIGMMPSEPESPIMAVQANFVAGGLLLAVCIHHSALDAAGVATVVKTWAGNTRLSTSGKSDFEPLTPLPSEAFGRRALLANPNTPPVDANEKIKNYPQYKLINTSPPPLPKDDEPTAPAPPFTLPPMTAAIFHFSAPALAELKSAASPSHPTTPGSYISTNDALCALLWRSIAKARNLPPDSTSMLGFAVDGRKRLSPPLPPPTSATSTSTPQHASPPHPSPTPTTSPPPHPSSAPPPQPSIPPSSTTSSPSSPPSPPSPPSSPASTPSSARTWLSRRGAIWASRASTGAMRSARCRASGSPRRGSMGCALCCRRWRTGDWRF